MQLFLLVQVYLLTRGFLIGADFWSQLLKGLV